MSRSGEIIQIHVGQAGIQIANSCWELYCIEHGITTEGILTQMPEDDSYKTFFSVTDTAKVVPRVIMVDTEPTVIDEIREGHYRHLFHPNTLITGKDDSGSNFARGYYTLGSELIEDTMYNIRLLAEKCDNLRGFLMFRSIGGGTGSGLGNLILEQISGSYEKLPKIEFIIFPSSSLSPLIVEPYNAILSTHAGMDTSDCSFIMDNEALYDICEKKLDISAPTYTNLNRIIGQVVSSFTASQRFPNDSNLSFGEFQTNLVPYPRIRFPLIGYAPLVNFSKPNYEQLNTQQLTLQCFQPSNQLVRSCDPFKGKYMACVLLYRGDVLPADVNTSITKLKESNATRFVDWSPTGFKVGINSVPPSFVVGGDLPPTNRSLLALTNNTSIQKAWCRLMKKYDRLMSRRAFVHHYIGEGMEEATLSLASENVCDLIREYQKVDWIDRVSISNNVPQNIGGATSTSER